MDICTRMFTEALAFNSKTSQIFIRELNVLLEAKMKDYATIKI